METQAGVKLNKKEISLIKSLERLAIRWEKDGKNLWLYSANSTLHVMMVGDTKRNDRPEFVSGGGVNQDNSITTINIPNDGGDW